MAFADTAATPTDRPNALVGARPTAVLNSPPAAPARAAPDPRSVRRTGDMAVAIPDGWRGERRAKLDGEALQLRFAGNPSGPVILALGGISATRCAADEGAVSADRRPGWWGGLVRAGGGVDLDRFCVASLDYPPLRPRGAIDLTTADFADLIRLGLEAAGVARLDGALGASFGGMIALALAERHADFVDRIAILCAAHRPSPMAQAQREIQRRILRLGVKTGAAREAVALARGLAMTTYRTPEEFADRFDVRLGSENSAGAYLAARGEAYAAQMTAWRYLALSAAIDRHDVAPEKIRIPALFIAAESDRLAPLADMLALQERYAGRSRLVALPSRYGHDAFLKETAAIAPHLQAFLKEI